MGNEKRKPPKAKARPKGKRPKRELVMLARPEDDETLDAFAERVIAQLRADGLLREDD